MDRRLARRLVGITIMQAIREPALLGSASATLPRGNHGKPRYAPFSACRCHRPPRPLSPMHGPAGCVLAIAHRKDEKVILDCIRVRHGSPEAATAEFAETVKSYGISTIKGDNYAKAWPQEAFRRHGILYIRSDQVRSDIYLAVAPLIRSGRVELLDHPKWLAAILARADELYSNRQLAKEQRFSKCIGGEARSVRGSVVNDGDKLGKLYHEAYKRAPAAKREAPPPVDFNKAVADSKGEAHARRHALAIDHARATGLPYARAYAHVYSHPDNRGLREKVKSEHIAATMRGDAV
jgi:hypothetical protein